MTETLYTIYFLGSTIYRNTTILETSHCSTQHVHGLYQNIPVDNIFVLFPDGSISLFGLASILVVCLDVPLDKAT